MMSNETAPPGAVKSGFELYGNDVMYNTGTTLQTQFWATPKSEDEWEIMWNVSGEQQNVDDVPVVLRPDPPPTAD